MLPLAISASHLLGKCRCLTLAEKETNSGSEEEGFVVDDFLKPAVFNVLIVASMGQSRNRQVL